VTPEQAVDRLNYESWKPSHLALPVPERCLGAFAGGFEEVDENVEYEERGDEFNIAKVLAMRSVLIVCTCFTLLTVSRARGMNCAHHVWL